MLLKLKNLYIFVLDLSLYVKNMNLMKRYLQIYMVLLLSILSTTIIKAQQFEDIKQLYSDESIYLWAENIFNLNDHKIIIVKCVDTPGNIFYDDVLIDPKPTDFINRDYFIYIKVDAKNNYISHFSTKNFYNNKSLWPSSESFTVSDGKFYAYYFQEDDKGLILGFDENFNLILNWNTFNLHVPRLKAKDGFLYIESFLYYYVPTIISKDTFDLWGDWRWVIKRNIAEDSTYYTADIRSGELADARPIQVNSKGEVIVGGVFANLFATHISIQGDSIFSVNGNADGYIYKLDKDGKLLYLKHLQGEGIERIRNVVVMENDEVYVVAQTVNSSDSNLDGVPIISDINENNQIIMKLDDKGNLMWQSFVRGAEYIFLDEMDESYFAIGFSYRNEIEISDTIYYGQGKFNAAFGKVNKSNGKIEIVKNLSNKCENYVNWFSKSILQNKFTVPISVSVHPDENFHFDNIPIDPKHVNSNYKFSLIISNFNFEKLSSLKQNMAQERILVYPNPLFTFSSLQIDSEVIFYMAQLYDIKGKVVLEKREDNIREISLENSQTIVSGVYFLKLYTDNQVVTKKIIIH